jgi:hypothetical protein
MLAPMSPAIKAITIGILALPLVLGGLGLATQLWVMVVVSLFLMLLFIAIWLWCRPLRFDIYSEYLNIVFPMWKRRIDISHISQIFGLGAGAFNQQFGVSLRMGVGGLWGGFGWLWTSKQGILEFYVSRLDYFVIIKRGSGYPLMITPENPNQFVEFIQELIT